MKYYLYDFDGTIYDGDSGVDIVLYTFKRYPKSMLLIPSIIWYGILYLLHIASKKEVKSRIFRVFKYVDDMDKHIEKFWDTHEKKLKKYWLSKGKHNKDIIISASSDIWLNYIKDKYKVHDLICTKMQLDGTISGNNCHGEEKVKVFYSKYPKGEILEMYTDSKNDYPLIREAKVGYLVKKDSICEYKTYEFNFVKRMLIKYKEIIAYLIVGVLTTLVSLASKWGLLFTILDVNNAFEVQISIVASWIISVAFAYITNRIFVFNSKSKKIFKEIIAFVSSRLLTLLLEMVLSYIFITLLKLNGKYTLMIVTVLIQGVIIVGNYILSKFLVFKKKN